MIQESSTSIIFQSVLESIIKPGQKLELFAPDYIDDLPEAEMLGVTFRAITMCYRVETNIPGVWLLYEDSSSNTIIPGYPEFSGHLHTESLSLRSSRPDFKKSPFMPAGAPPTLDAGLQFAMIKVRFDGDHRLNDLEISSHLGNVVENKKIGVLVAHMINLVSSEIQKLLG